MQNVLGARRSALCFCNDSILSYIIWSSRNLPLSPFALGLREPNVGSVKTCNIRDPADVVVDNFKDVLVSCFVLRLEDDLATEDNLPRARRVAECGDDEGE